MPNIYPRRVPWRAVVAYVVIASALAWLVALPLWLSGGLANPFAALLLPVMMFTPLAATVLVLAFVQRPRPRPVLAYLGVWPLPPLGRLIGMIVLGIVGSALIVILGVFLAAALGFVQLDLVHFSAFAARLQTSTHTAIPIPVGVLVAIQIIAIPFGAVLNGVVTIGEEIGWRGWLLPSLRPLGKAPSLVLTGLIWGFWHSPIILLGYNFAQPNILGVLLMMGGCAFYGVLIGWLRLHSGSVWPSVFAHGGFNAAAGFLLLVASVSSRPNPVFTGPLGIVTWIVMALAIAVLAVTVRRRDARQDARADTAG